MTGITSGTYTMQQKLYNSSDCQTPTLTQTVYAQGIWQDLGPLDTTATVRWFLPEECLTHLIAIFSPFVQFGRRPVRLFQPLSVPSSPLPHPAVCARIGPHSCCLFLPDTTLLGWMMLHFVQFAAHSFPVPLAVSSEATMVGCSRSIYSCVAMSTTSYPNHVHVRKLTCPRTLCRCLSLATIHVHDKTNVRKLFVNVVQWMITPETVDQARLLNDISDGCPCGGTWVSGQTRTLSTCVQGKSVSSAGRCHSSQSVSFSTIFCIVYVCQTDTKAWVGVDNVLCPFCAQALAQTMQCLGPVSNHRRQGLRSVNQCSPSPNVPQAASSSVDSITCHRMDFPTAWPTQMNQHSSNRMVCLAQHRLWLVITAANSSKRALPRLT
jgi:hypothetical protein